ncbi:ATP-binding protein [Actinacidiphila acidipaludis]|uniref:ATP-binding protein n=1 Tax=Actinacidiphila acidipaludis TaxID=2873382 RepID=A0ABS7Q3L7_9ACTN|nr:ATP-binding protein [Streptomyces acidipaludis]MBY8876359.1 ATP-binding protein [Streptomyces acidipaludis]
MTDTETILTALPARALVVNGDCFADIAHARDAAGAFAGGLDPSPSRETAQALALVVSELTTNALRHGGGRYTLRLTAGPDALEVAVSDLSPTPPREREPALHTSGGGFGWPLIRGLTSEVSIIPGPDGGKTIHACLPR